MAFDFSEFRLKLGKAQEHIRHELSLLRTGKATVQLLDSVVVEAYGTRLKINEVANLSAPDATLLVVTPWDKSLLSAVERAIQVAELNLNPIVDKDLIRIVVPPLTAERRQELVKTLHQKVEAARVMLRALRTDTKKDIEKQKGSAGVSEDDITADVKQLDDFTKRAMDELDSLAEAKEKDLLTI